MALADGNLIGGKSRWRLSGAGHEIEARRARLIDISAASLAIERDVCHHQWRTAGAGGQCEHVRMWAGLAFSEVIGRHARDIIGRSGVLMDSFFLALLPPHTPSRYSMAGSAHGG